MYQGKEYVTDFCYNTYDFHTRQYDPYTGSFNQVDGANQFASGYTGMGNNPVVGVDPDGQFVLAAFLLFTQKGYNIQKQLSPFALHLNYHRGSDVKGFGYETSIGVPKALPISYRRHYGATKYYRYYDNAYVGQEKKSGSEWTLFRKFSFSGTKYESGELSQTTNMINIGGIFTNFKYENDYMFGLDKYFPGVPAEMMETVFEQQEHSSIRVLLI